MPNKHLRNKDQTSLLINWSTLSDDEHLAVADLIKHYGDEIWGN